MVRYKIVLVIIMLGALLFSTSAIAASSIDWYTTTLSGTFPNFFFSHSALGNVSLTYSNNVNRSGIGTVFAHPTLLLGNTGGLSLTMSWTIPVTKLEIEIWDVDAIPNSGESVTFLTTATASLGTLHPTDLWDQTTQELSDGGSSNPNTQLGNFTVISFANSAGFNSITFNWNVVGNTGTMGIGKINGIISDLDDGYISDLDDGYKVTSELWTKAILQVPGNPVTLVWKMVGADITPSGDQVISGYFYADPNDFAYGSEYNPELFVKIYVAKNGWCNIAYNHVTVDDVMVYSAHNYAGAADKTGSVTLNSRLDEHQYDGVSLQ